MPEEKTRTWVGHYRLRGIDRLRSRRNAYSAQFKLQVLAQQDRDRERLTAVTKSHVNGHKLYLSACMDLYNGEIIVYRIMA